MMKSQINNVPPKHKIRTIINTNMQTLYLINYNLHKTTFIKET